MLSILLHTHHHKSAVVTRVYRYFIHLLYNYRNYAVSFRIYVLQLTKLQQYARCIKTICVMAADDRVGITLCTTQKGNL